ncbi:hypothetical protein P6709_08335 [Jeotgalibacillus sp. ET6]|uniref:hypothetical protein n=1 Tax=Jeotgalibacillus sp. ET6 TaxID=3037260 RepID=UPI0024188FBE|nr:hypothetical protein [Jeotgalibacillus sp. ET6]MDG5471754.1 hypothetical protein [Jeotgalibacillus sp. ET6]
MIESTALQRALETIDEYNESHFDIENSIKEAKIILQSEMDSKHLSSCYFEEMKWYLEIPYESKRESIDFNQIKDAIQFNKHIPKDQFVDIVKCWVSSNLDEGYNPQTIITMVNESLLVFLQITKGLTERNQDELADVFLNMSDSMRRYVCSGMLNFFDYYNEFSFDVDEYISLLYSVKPKSEKSVVRIIPPSKDILVFSKVLENYFSSNLSEIEYLKWFSVWLWWNLTNLIPMRPSEYCNIERDCLIENNGKFYIKLPRHKIKETNKRRIQILDKINIPESLYRKIEDYKEKTNGFGRTDTLISYLSIPNMFEGKYWMPTDGTYSKRLNPYRFTNSIFRSELKVFFNLIVFGQYNVTLNRNPLDSDVISITQQLKPGDTRHLAFINLNRQGYHPVEIARLGGHISIDSQNHYFNHVQNYVDLEILELISNIDLGSYSEKLGNSDEQQDTSIGTSFIEKFVLRPSNSDVKNELVDGYCTDEFQNCMVEDCWECDSWRISREELMEKQNLLAKKLNESKDEINDVVANLRSLYNNIYNYTKDEFYSADNPEIRKELINRSKRIDNAIKRYVNLTKVKERIDYNGNEG